MLGTVYTIYKLAYRIQTHVSKTKLCISEYHECYKITLVWIHCVIVWHIKVCYGIVTTAKMGVGQPFWLGPWNGGLCGTQEAWLGRIMKAQGEWFMGASQPGRNIGSLLILQGIGRATRNTHIWLGIYHPVTEAWNQIKVNVCAYSTINKDKLINMTISSNLPQGNINHLVNFRVAIKMPNFMILTIYSNQ